MLSIQCGRATNSFRLVYNVITLYRLHKNNTLKKCFCNSWGLVYVLDIWKYSAKKQYWFVIDHKAMGAGEQGGMDLSENQSANCL